MGPQDWIIVGAIPVFFVLMWIEFRVIRRREATGESSLIGYEPRDTKASLLMGVGSIFTVGVLRLAAIGIGVWLWQFRWFDLGPYWGFAAAMVAWDFTFYWQHRFGHEVRFGWASHVNHHSSQHYNLSTALRQEWSEFSYLVMYPLWSLVGIHPVLIASAGAVNLIYQYWIHTEAIDKMPRWFEFVLNTPSHHRVHHGSNSEYLDKNYAGILILWDRMFGTFEPEVERVRYGLTKNINSFRIRDIAFHEWRAMGRDLVAARGAKARWMTVFGPPGWKAEMT